MLAAPDVKILYAVGRSNRRDKTRQILRRTEFDLREAGCGREALQLAHQCPPDLILLDEHLDDLTALEVCRQLKAGRKARAIPILLQCSPPDNGMMRPT